MKKRVITSGEFLLLIVVGFVSLGCRFTVREIGFADIFPTNYKLFLFTGNVESREFTANISEISKELFKNSNVDVKVIDIEMQATHPGMVFYKRFSDRPLPFAVLVSPEGRQTPVQFDAGVQSVNFDLGAELRKTISSPLRETILQKLVVNYAVVLLIEGKNRAENKIARNEIQKTIQEIEKVMDRMPKPVKSPPELVILPHYKRTNENILLWSVGYESLQTSQPVAVVLYGRGRHMGEPLQFADIQGKMIYRLLTLIGADCECGLDRKWLLGNMVPISWGQQLQHTLASNNGFDVENPMIKLEMSQIVTQQAQRTNNLPDNLFEPKEFDLSTDIVPDTGDAENSDVPEISFEHSQASPEQEDRAGERITMVFVLTIVLLLIIAGTGFIIIIRRIR